MAAAMQDDKAALRARVRALRAAVPADERAAAAGAIAHHLASFWDRLTPGAIVAGYVARGAELDPALALDAARRRGLRVAYPRVVLGSRHLSFHVASPDDLVDGAFALREPPTTAPRVDADDLAIVLVPGIAFTAAGARLGAGGGYYDTTFADGPGPIRIGLALPCQLLATLPREAHDLPVHHVLTPAGLGGV